MTILAFSNSSTILFHIFNAEKLLIHNKEKKIPQNKPKQCKPEFFFQAWLSLSADTVSRDSFQKHPRMMGVLLWELEKGMELVK